MRGGGHQLAEWPTCVIAWQYLFSFVRSFQFCNDTETFIVLPNREAKPRVLNSLKPTDVLLRSVGSDNLFSWLARSPTVFAFYVTSRVFLHETSYTRATASRDCMLAEFWYFCIKQRDPWCNCRRWRSHEPPTFSCEAKLGREMYRSIRSTQLLPFVNCVSLSCFIGEPVDRVLKRYPSFLVWN